MRHDSRFSGALLATSLVALSVLIVSIVVGGEAKSSSPQPIWQVTGTGIQDVVWTNLTNATATGSSIQHSGSGYFAKGQSQQTISGAGYFEWTFDGDSCSVGFGNNNDEAASAGYFDLDFAFELHPQGYGIRERGVYRGEGALAVGDVLRIEIASNGDVLYKKNGAIVHTTLNPANVFPYYLVIKTSEVAGLSISAAIVTYPSDYVGKYFYAEFCSGWIRRYDPTTSTSRAFVSGISFPVDLKVGPDGNLYYLVRGGGGAVFKIIFR